MPSASVARHRALNVVMLGPPGAGKGTQAERLAQRPRAAEDLDRRHPARGGAGRHAARQRRAKATDGRRRLVSDDVMIGIVQERLEQDGCAARVRARRLSADGAQADGARRDGRDGAGRWSCSTSWCRKTCWCGGWRRGGSAASAARTPGRGGRSAASAAARWCTRTDDGDGIVRERLKVYQRQTKPLVDYYSARPTFRSIDGNQAADAVTQRVDAAIDAAAAAGRAQRCDRLQVAGGDRADARAPTRWSADVLAELPAMAAPGVTTADLDAAGRAAGARGGRRAGVQGLSRVSGDALRVGERARSCTAFRRAGRWSRATSSRSTWA